MMKKLLVIILVICGIFTMPFGVLLWILAAIISK